MLTSPKRQTALAPLLEALVDGHPDVKVDFGLGDVVAGQELAEARGVLLQHVSMVFPSTAVSEHLQQRQKVFENTSGFATEAAEVDSRPGSDIQRLQFFHPCK